jgi:hypothetical protein
MKLDKFTCDSCGVGIEIPKDIFAQSEFSEWFHLHITRNGVCNVEKREFWLCPTCGDKLVEQYHGERILTSKEHARLQNKCRECGQERNR